MVAQAGLELMTFLLPQPLECWACRSAPPHTAAPIAQITPHPTPPLFICVLTFFIKYLRSYRVTEALCGVRNTTQQRTGGWAGVSKQETGQGSMKKVGPSEAMQSG